MSSDETRAIRKTPSPLTTSEMSPKNLLKAVIGKRPDVRSNAMMQEDLRGLIEKADADVEKARRRLIERKFDEPRLEMN